MKTLTRIICTTVFLSLVPLAQAQVEWNEIPAIPLNPSAGQTNVESYDVMMSEDGRVYAAYIFNTAGTYELYVQEYVAGTGWNQIYTDMVFDGFQTIHSFKSGTQLYFFVKGNNAAMNDKMRLYNISSGTVSMVTDFDFDDIPDGADFRAVLSESGNYIYMLHKDMSDAALVISQFNLSNGNVIGMPVPTGSSALYNFDLVEHQDTVYIGSTRAETANNYRTYLHKISVLMDGVVPHHPGNTDGQLGGSGPSTTLMGLIMSKDILAHNILLLSRDETSCFSYTFIPALLITNFGGSPINYASASLASPAAYVGSTKSLHFGAFTDNPINLYSTQVFVHDNAANTNTLYSNFNFNNVGDQASAFRFGYSEILGLAVAELYDGVQGKNRYYMSNHVPTVVTTGTSAVACPTTNTTLFSGIDISDSDGNPISIIDVEAADQSIFPDGSLTANLTGQVIYTYTFSIDGVAAQGGTTDITITFTDGIDTMSYTLPSTTVTNATVPQFNQASIALCSGNGNVELAQIVQPTGGTFSLGGSSVPAFNGSQFNTNVAGILFGSQMQLQYSIQSMGCTTSASIPFVLNESAVASIAVSPTTCGGATGTAIATVTGGSSPLLLEAWSSGQTNVSSLNGLAQGTYTYTVQNTNLCTTITEFTIVPTGVDIVPTITNASCYGANDGSISVALNGFTAPTSMIWSSGHSSNAVSDMVPGTYTVTVTDAANCIYTEAFTVTQPTQLSAVNVIDNPTCGTTDGSMEVQTISGGVGPYTVQWSTGGTGTIANNIGYGVYSATITDFTGCQTIRTFYVSEDNSGNLAGTITGSQCGSSTGGIDVTPLLPSGVGIQNISWSSGQTTEDISSVPAALYICTLATDANCHAVKGWNIPIVAPELQPICVVTVDSVTSTNLVVWEEVQTVGIAYYNIYRETSVQGEYVLIDTVQASNTSLFNDVVASPIIRSWSYKIAAVNGCNVEGPLSAQHRTMHLSALANGTTQTDISWNAYEGTAYSSFVLYRFTDAAGWEEVDVLPITQLSYTDNTAFSTPGLDYMVELSLDEQCSALIYRAQDFNTTRSNKDKGNFIVGQGTGDSNNDVNELLLDQMQLYPNPVENTLMLVQDQANALNVRFIDLSGKTISTHRVSGLSNSFDISTLEDGTYLVEIELNGTKRVTRIVKL